MSRENDTISRAEALRKRREEEHTRRSATTKKMGGISGLLPAKKAERTTRVLPAVTPGRLRRQYAVASPAYAGGRRTNTPAFSIPRFEVAPGPRLASFLLAIACAAMLYIMATAEPFIVRSVEIRGNLRLQPAEIERILGALNQPAAMLNPAQIEYNVLYSFPEVSGVLAEVNFPAGLVITINERTPSLAWQQGETTTWVDAQGYGFAPRGEAPEGIIAVQAAGAPPALPETEAAPAVGASRLLSAEMASAILTLTPSLPEGATLVYDPEYGLGWSDPGGWQVYFGHARGDMGLKLQVYQGVLSHLNTQDVQPSLISVAYPAAPFYRVEQ